MQKIRNKQRARLEVLNEEIQRVKRTRVRMCSRVCRIAVMSGMSCCQDIVKNGVGSIRNSFRSAVFFFAACGKTALLFQSPTTGTVQFSTLSIIYQQFLKITDLQDYSDVENSK